jgi:hypothetical protein
MASWCWVSGCSDGTKNENVTNFQVPDVKVDGIANIGTGDVYVASRERIASPVGHRNILAVVREH